MKEFDYELDYKSLDFTDAGMQITVVGKNTILVGKYIPKNQIGRRVRKLYRRMFLSELEIKSPTTRYIRQ